MNRRSNAGVGLLGALKHDKVIIESLPAPAISELVYNGSNCYGLLTEDAAAELRAEIDSINETLCNRWTTAIQRLVNTCASREKEKEEEIEEIGRQIAELEPKIEHSGKLYKAMASLNDERKKLRAAEAIEREIDRLRDDRDHLFDSICATRNKLFEACSEFSKEIEPLSASMADGLDFSAEVVWRKKDFESSVINMLDRRRLGAFERVTNIDLQNLTDEDYCDELLLDIWNSIKGNLDDCQLMLKSDITENEFLGRLFGDWYEIHYVVTSGGDRLDKMSPGKKGLVLLELIVELEQGDCPILIDQPEDDLDNQSIYSELRRFIKESKKRRQIIIVTHNANIALGADAEEIIVANQHGQGRENAKFKFEYRSGAIENNVVPDNDSEVCPFLNRYSIQQHACQILDGGKEALEQRRRKYSMGV